MLKKNFKLKTDDDDDDRYLSVPPPSPLLPKPLRHQMLQRLRRPRKLFSKTFLARRKAVRFYSY